MHIFHQVVMALNYFINFAALDSGFDEGQIKLAVIEG